MANAKKKEKPVTPKTDPLNKRSRSFELLTYIDIEEVRRYCLRDNVSNYAYIVHDMDIYDEDVKDQDGNLIHVKGDKKEPHIHVVLTFKEARTLRAVSKDFSNFDQNTRSIITKDLERSLMYLTHEYEENKFKYSRDKVTASYAYFNGSHSGTADNVAVQIMNDFDSGIELREMVRRYGRDFVIHFRQYYQMHQMCNGIVAIDEIHELRRQLEQRDELISTLNHDLTNAQYELGSKERTIARLTRIAKQTCAKIVTPTLIESLDNTDNPF